MKPLEPAIMTRKGEGWFIGGGSFLLALTEAASVRIMEVENKVEIILII